MKPEESLVFRRGQVVVIVPRERWDHSSSSYVNPPPFLGLYLGRYPYTSGAIYEDMCILNKDNNLWVITVVYGPAPSVLPVRVKNKASLTGFVVSRGRLMDLPDFTLQPKVSDLPPALLKAADEMINTVKQNVDLSLYSRLIYKK
jgi:hypothetical protein